MTSQEKQELLERIRRDSIGLTGESNPHASDLAFIALFANGSALEVLSKLLFLIGRQEAND